MRNTRYFEVYEYEVSFVVTDYETEVLNST